MQNVGSCIIYIFNMYHSFEKKFEDPAWLFCNLYMAHIHVIHTKITIQKIRRNQPLQQRDVSRAINIFIFQYPWEKRTFLCFED